MGRSNPVVIFDWFSPVSAAAANQAIQALAGKLQAAAAAGDSNAREWMLDLKEITLGCSRRKDRCRCCSPSTRWPATTSEPGRRAAPVPAGCRGHGGCPVAPEHATASSWVRPVVAGVGKAQLGSARRHRGNPAAARQGRLLSRKRGRSGSDDEEVQVTADRCQRFAADPAQLASGSLIGHGTDLLRHGIRNLLQPGVVIRGNLYVMVEVAIPGGERHREEQPGYHRVALVRHHDDRAYATLLPAGHRIKVTEQYVTAGQELYSGYSSAAVAARSPMPADVHSTASA